MYEYSHFLLKDVNSKINNYQSKEGACSSTVGESLSYKLEGHGFETQ
jgi:hypothetical protein